MKNIAIIGGGFTGLTTAYRLLKDGQEVEIFEKSDHLGGLASGFRIENGPLEIAYHHLFKSDTAIIDLIKELGLEEKLEWRTSSLGLYYDKKIYPFVTPIDLIKFSPLSFINRIRAGVVVLYLQKIKSWKGFMKTTAYEWMKKWAGNQVVKVIWEPLLKGKFETYYDKISMSWLWARIHIRANSKDKGESEEKLGYPNGGFEIIVKALEKEIIRLGGKIHLNSNIEGIDSENKPFIMSDGKKLIFDKILATVPTHIFANLISNSKAQIPNSQFLKYIESLKSIDYIGACLMIFSSDQDISPFYWNNINDLESPFLVFINHTKFIPKERYNNKNIYYIGSYIPHTHPYFTMTNEEIERKWLDYLKVVFPNFDESQIRQKFVFKLKYAQHIVDTNYINKIPAYKTPLDNIFLANFSQIFPQDRGTNYAVEEGNKIAEIIQKP